MMQLPETWKLKSPATKGTRQLDTTVARIFAASAMPYLEIHDDDVLEMITELNLPLEEPKCFYCGDEATQWDHLGALVKGSNPTGYITCIANLIPSCYTCNTSRGNLNYEMWMKHLKDDGSPLKGKNKCPKCRGLSDEQIEENIRLIKRFEQWAHNKMTRKIDLENLDEETKKNLDKLKKLQLFILKASKKADKISSEIRATLEAKVERKPL